jgi:twitching motility protein PilU
VDIEKLLAMMVLKQASDLFITVGVAPSMKINGKMTPVAKTALNEALVEKIVLGTMDDKQRKEFLDKKELNFAIASTMSGRFRVSAFYQRNNMGMVLRRIENIIPRAEELDLPEILTDLVMAKRGLLILVGATGAGKSTTLAALIGHRNRNSKGHIISIEDPIEFVHQHEGCIITQREVGIDTESFEVALKNTLRQAPDVILIGEVRSKETMEHALAFAETGHLCLCTMHANNANQALDRIMHFFPPERHDQLWMDLSLNLQAMVAQQLIATPDGKGRKACVEILINTPLISDMIRKGDVHNLKEQMSKSREQGMQTYDQALFDLYKTGQITYEDALSHADSSNDLRLLIKLSKDDKAGGDGFKLENGSEDGEF